MEKSSDWNDSAMPFKLKPSTDSMTHKKPVVVILGPTAVGKSRLAIKIAEVIPGEIVSADSRLVYRLMNIGTAKPSQEELQRVRHHLIDVVDPGQEFSLADYQRLASQAIREIHAQGKVAYLVGGTGQYLNAVLEGWRPPPRSADRSLRAELRRFAEERGSAALHKRLKAVDPVRAQEIHPHNVRRVVRALEIFQVTGQPPSSLRTKEPPLFEILKIGLTMERELLHERITTRVDRMLDSGLIEEVEGLLAAGVPDEASALSAIGYPQILAYIKGRCSLEVARAQIVSETLDFLRRQNTWFKPDDSSIEWFEVGKGLEAQVMARIQGWLADQGPKV